MRIRECAPLCLTCGPGLGRGLKRFGVDRRLETRMLGRASFDKKLELRFEARRGRVRAREEFPDDVVTCSNRLSVRNFGGTTLPFSEPGP
jgi:hypothetical protein